MLIRLAHGIDWLTRASCHVLQTRFIAWTRPPHPGLARGVVVDLARGKAELVAENALLRQQLIVLQRQSKRPSFTRLDRLLLLLLASRIPTWTQAVTLAQPETLLHRRRQGFRPRVDLRRCAAVRTRP